jgi:hypothetical protein
MTTKNAKPTQHTPGPWKVDDWSEIWAEADAEGICSVNTHRNLMRAFADARLIAAAPELLEALGRLEIAARSVAQNARLANARANARAAIAKATGEES